MFFVTFFDKILLNNTEKDGTKTLLVCIKRTLLTKYVVHVRIYTNLRISYQVCTFVVCVCVCMCKCLFFCLYQHIWFHFVSYTNSPLISVLTHVPVRGTVHFGCVTIATILRVYLVLKCILYNSLCFL